MSIFNTHVISELFHNPVCLSRNLNASSVVCFSFKEDWGSRNFKMQLTYLIPDSNLLAFKLANLTSLTIISAAIDCP